MLCFTHEKTNLFSMERMGWWFIHHLMHARTVCVNASTCLCMIIMLLLIGMHSHPCNS